jgi:hypothetical protein
MNDEILKHFRALLSIETEQEFKLYDAIFGGDDDVSADPNYQVALDAVLALSDD